MRLATDLGRGCLVFAIRCPRCEHAAVLTLYSSESGNDNLDIEAVMAPEGFRKVQFGWETEVPHLFCIDCEIPADLVRPT